MTRAQYEKAQADYRRTYDRLYVQSMRAGSAEECDRLDAALRRANDKLAAAKAAFEGS